ncbi:hypothetical protein D3C77_407180 [compost metagenome]
MERLKRVDLLPERCEFDRAAGNRLDGQRRTAASIAVQLGQHDPRQLELLIEALSHVDGILPRHRIDDKQHFIRLRYFMNLTKLLHQFFVNMQPSRGVNQQVIVAVILRMLQGLSGNLHGAVSLGKREYGNLDLLAKHLKLLNSRWTINISRHKQRTVIPLQ